MSFTNREFSWDLLHLNEFWEDYVKAYVNKGYAFGGAKKVSDTITTSDRKMFYLLTEVGTYANMSSSIVHQSGIGIALWNGSAWSYQNVPMTTEMVTEKQEVANITSASDPLYRTPKGYIDPSTGAFVSYSGYSTTLPIHLSSGAIVKYMLNGNGIAYLCEADGADDMGPYTVILSGNLNRNTEKQYIAPRDMWIVMCSASPNGTTDYINITEDKTLEGIIGRLDNLESEIDALAISENPSADGDGLVKSGGVYASDKGEYVFRFEMGNITINSTSWTYSASTTRMRTPQGYTIPLEYGDYIEVGSNTRVYIGWEDGDGVKHTYENGWFNATNIPIKEKGNYVFTASYLTESTITDAEEFAKTIVVHKNDLPVTEHSRFFNKDASNLFDIEPLSSLWNFDGETFSGTARALQERFGESVYYPISSAFEEGERYVVTLEARSDYVSSGNGVLLRAKYTDGTTASLATIPCSITNWVKYVTITTSGKSLSAIYFAAGGQPDTTQYIRNIGIFKYDGKYSMDFAPKETMVDNVARYAISEKRGESSLVKSIAHRGWYEAPENTIVAYALAKKSGYQYGETDVRFTSDNIPVLLHDASINRVARNSDGTELSSTINIADITYDQALTYDFGIYKGSAWAGTKIATFAEYLQVCRNIGLKPYIELKAGTTSQIQMLCDMVRGYGLEKDATFISFTKSYLEIVKAYSPKARLGLVTNALDSTGIDNAISLRTGDNEVFIDPSSTTAETLEIAKANGLPVETWVSYNYSQVANADPYISGITAEQIVPSQILYDISMQ